MTLPILYSFRRCPYAIRARMALHKAGVEREHREVSLGNKPAAMTTISPKATVPVFQLQDGQVMDESLDIMLWALEQHDPDGWLDTDMTAAMRLVNINDYSFKNQLDRYKYHVRYPEQSQLDYRVAAEDFLQLLEQQLVGTGGNGICTSRTSVADIAIFPFVRQFVGVDRVWFENSVYQHLLKWFVRMETRQEFLNVMDKHAYWQPGDQAIVTV